MRIGVAAARVCVLLALAAPVVGATMSCQAPADQGGQTTVTEAQKSGAGELRSDTEPLTKRFPVLAGPFVAQWMSGTYGDPDNPGPSTYWIDAVITLKPEQIDSLRTTYRPTPTSETPAVVAGLREQLPQGPFLTGDALDEAFRHERWWASAYLDPQAGKLVLVATGT